MDLGSYTEEENYELQMLRHLFAKLTNFNFKSAGQKDLEHNHMHDLSLLEPKDIVAIIQDLESHQEELRVQNEELVASKLEIDRLYTKYQDIYDNSPIGYFIINISGQIVEVNQTAVLLLGYNKEEIRRFKYLTIFVAPEDRGLYLQFFSLLITAHTPRNVALRLKKRNGENIYCNIEGIADSGSYSNGLTEFRIAISDISQLKKAEDEVLRLNKFLEKRVQERTEELEQVNHELTQEIAERKAIEQELRLTAAELRRLNVSKDKLFSLISHDLRSPFTSLLSLLNILVNSFENIPEDKLKEYLNKIYTNAKSVFNLIENLLQWSRIQIEGFDILPTHFSIQSLVDKVIYIHKQQAELKKITVLNDTQSNPFIYADQNMVGAVLRNLLSNAIKFTNKDGVIRFNSEVQNNQLKISIEDSGIGIDPEVQNSLFRQDRFISTAGTNNEQGTGLGLILCKELIEKNNGKIDVLSKPGLGTTFWFTLPISPHSLNRK